MTETKKTAKKKSDSEHEIIADYNGYDYKKIFLKTYSVEDMKMLLDSARKIAKKDAKNSIFASLVSKMPLLSRNY